MNAARPRPRRLYPKYRILIVHGSRSPASTHFHRVLAIKTFAALLGLRAPYVDVTLSTSIEAGRKLSDVTAV